MLVRRGVVDHIGPDGAHGVAAAAPVLPPAGTTRACRAPSSPSRARASTWTLTRATPPRGGWRLIAVDNASTDGTGDLMRSYADRLPIVVLHEPQAGKNRALNRAIEVAEGDFYVFTDDDVLVGENWLAAWRDVAEIGRAHV